MKRPNTRQIPSNAPVGKRFRTLLALGVLGLAGTCGYECGQSSQDDRIAQLEADSAAKDKRLAEAEEGLEQARKAVNRVVQSGRLTRRELSKAEERLDNPDEAVCSDVIDKALRDKLSRLAGFLGITNPADLNKLLKAMRRGYKEVTRITLDGSVITMTDADGKWEWVNLEEPIEDVPHEYLSDWDKVEKSDEELALAQKIEGGEYDEVVNNFDIETIRPTDEDPDSLENKAYGLITDLQSDLSNTTDPNTRKELFCGFFGSIIKLELLEEGLDGDDDNDSDSDSPTSPEEVRRSRLENLFMDALAKSAGVKDEDECISHIFNLP